MSETIETHAATQVAVHGGIVACLMLSDANAAIAFYEKAFGGEVMQTIPDKTNPKKLMHAHMKINGSSLIFNDAFPEYGMPLQAPQGYVLHLQAPDVDVWWKRALEAGCQVAMPLEVQFWGDRYGQVKDPFGVTWSIASPA